MLHLKSISDTAGDILLNYLLALEIPLHNSDTVDRGHCVAVGRGVLSFSGIYFVVTLWSRCHFVLLLFLTVELLSPPSLKTRQHADLRTSPSNQVLKTAHAFMTSCVGTYRLHVLPVA